MDWRAEIKNETREKIVKSICAKLKEQCSAFRSDAMDLKQITNLVMEREKKLFKDAKSKEQYFNALTRKRSRSENPHESSSSQDRPAFCSDQSVVIIKKEGAFESHPSPQMTNQPHQLAVRNPRYQQPAVPNSLLQQHIQQLTPQPHEQLHRQKLNVRQTHQQFGMHNQNCVCPQNTLNSPCRPQGFQGRDFGIHKFPEMFTQRPKVVNLQPNENLRDQVKEEVIGEDFHASTFLHQHHSAIEQHKQHQSEGVSAVPNGNPNAEDWHNQALSEVRRLRTYLPLLNKAYERASEQYLRVGQTEKMQKCEQEKNILQKIINFLKLPGDRIISYTKEKFYRCVQIIVRTLKVLQNGNINLANKLQPLHGQPSLSQSQINPVQQSDNVNPNFQTVNLATTGSSSIAPREIGSSRSEADGIQKYLLHNTQHSENIKQEFQSSWIQQKQKSKENVQAINKSGMYLKYHLNSKFSPQSHEASQPSQIAEQALSVDPCATLYGRASPAPSSSTVGLGKNSSNVSYLSSPNSQFPQGCNSLKLHNSKTEIQVQSREIRSSSKMTCQLAEPTSLGNNGQLSTATQPPNRLLKAVESISNEALRVAVSEISSVGNMEDRISEPWCRGKAAHLSLQDGCGSSNNIKRKINAATLNDMPSPCSDLDGSEPTVTSRSKKLKKLSDNALLEEMRNINKQFIETVLELDTDENVNRRLASAGTVLRCSYRVATESKKSVFHSANTLKLPVLSVKLLVPLDYPEDYPVFLSKFNTDCGTEDEEFRHMSNEATLMLRAFLRTAPDYLSLEDYAKAWNECARAVVSEHAQRAGGGCFSSRYGTWEDCVAAT